MVKQIDDFMRECAEDEYTDTDEALELIAKCRKTLSALTKVTVTITIKGGALSDVDGLPAGWKYTLIDKDV